MRTTTGHAPAIMPPGLGRLATVLARASAGTWQPVTTGC